MRRDTGLLDLKTEASFEKSESWIRDALDDKLVDIIQRGVVVEIVLRGHGAPISEGTDYVFLDDNIAPDWNEIVGDSAIFKDSDAGKDAYRELVYDLIKMAIREQVVG